MNFVNSSIEIAVPVETVWETVMDPLIFEDWVTVHHKLHGQPKLPLTEGSQFAQTLKIPGLPLFKVSWTVETYEEPLLTVWEGSGPARSYARSEYRLEPTKNGGTHFNYINEFAPPGGPLGKLAGKAILGGISEREATASLNRLKLLLEASN